MVGFPKHLNTRADLELVMNEFPRSQWAPKLQAMLDNRMVWWNRGKLNIDEPGTMDETHKVVTMDNMSGGDSERYQYEYIEDPNCQLFRLGMSVAEVENILQGE